MGGGGRVDDKGKVREEGEGLTMKGRSGRRGKCLAMKERRRGGVDYAEGGWDDVRRRKV